MERKEEIIRLTKRENEIIWKLQNGWVLITGQDFGAFVSKGFRNDQIRLDVFFRLVARGLIYQETTHFNYVLTGIGKSIKTKTP